MVQLRPPLRFHVDRPTKDTRPHQSATETGARALQSADYLILTLGTAWIYRLKSNERIVCNCHKQPAAHFIRERLSAETIVEQFALLAEGCLRNKRILWSVSPVRHIGDGLIDNAWSKAILLDAVHRIVERFPNNEYFPSFEIVNDDLRDYRFYDKDMVHPSELAVDYIWEQFQESHISHEARTLFKRIEALHRAMAHRPFNPDSPAHDGSDNAMPMKHAALCRNTPIWISPLR